MMKVAEASGQLLISSSLRTADVNADVDAYLYLFLIRPPLIRPPLQETASAALPNCSECLIRGSPTFDPEMGRAVFKRK